MVVFISNTISMWLPNKSKNKYVQKILDLLNRLSLNIYKNANKAERYVAKVRRKRKVTRRRSPLSQQDINEALDNQKKTVKRKLAGSDD